MSEREVAAIIDEIEATYTAYTEATDEIETIGWEQAEQIREAVQGLNRLLDRYEDRATGTGDFGGYIAFRGEVDELVEELPDELAHRDEFETVADIVDKRRLSEDDFAKARQAVGGAREVANRLSEVSQLRADYQDTRREAKARLEEIDDRIAELDRLLTLGAVDLDAPVEDIQDPIERYNDAVTEAFSTYLHDVPAADVLDLFGLTDRYPLVPMEAPPPTLETYLEDLEESLTVPELLEYADYSRSKLDHYVADPVALRSAVAADRTYLERLSADPFTIDWPPPQSDVLRWHTRELLSVVGRFASSDVLEKLRTVQDIARNTERFDELREVAVARSSISPEQRERLLSGDIEDERDAFLTARDRLETTLDETPSPD